VIDAMMTFGCGVLATYYGWRPTPAGSSHLEWVQWDRAWGRLFRILGPLLIAGSLIGAVFR
jgi:hypothetical protein